MGGAQTDCACSRRFRGVLIVARDRSSASPAAHVRREQNGSGCRRNNSHPATSVGTWWCASAGPILPLPLVICGSVPLHAIKHKRNVVCLSACTARPETHAICCLGMPCVGVAHTQMNSVGLPKQSLFATKHNSVLHFDELYHTVHVQRAKRVIHVCRKRLAGKLSGKLPGKLAGKLQDSCCHSSSFSPSCSVRLRRW